MWQLQYHTRWCDREEQSAMCCVIILEVIPARIITLLAWCKTEKKKTKQNKKATAATIRHAYERYLYKHLQVYEYWCIQSSLSLLLWVDQRSNLPNSLLVNRQTAHIMASKHNENSSIHLSFIQGLKLIIFKSCTHIHKRMKFGSTT